MNKKILSILINIFVYLLFVCLIVTLVYTCSYSDSLEYELKQRDFTIKLLNNRDSVNRILLNNRYSVDSLLKNRNGISTSELVRYVNDLSDEVSALYDRINMLNDSLRFFKIYYDYNQSFFNHKYVVTKNVNGGRNYSILLNGVKKEEYQKCQSIILNQNNKIYELESKINSYKRILDYYDIKECKQNSDIIYPSPYFSPKLDSALMLLEAYRNKLKYDKSKKKWSVGNRMDIFISEPIMINDTIAVNIDSLIKK